MIFLMLMAACRSDVTEQELSIIEGATMGTYYRVSYWDAEQSIEQAGIDTLLRAINQEVSTYIENSTISHFNRADSGILLGDVPHFRANLEIARQVYQQTKGAYDPTVMPLVNYWGFGYVSTRPATKVDSMKIDSLLQLVGMDKVRLSGDSLLKDRPGVQLDFSGCAKGYAVDVIAEWLSQQGIQSYLVDIGGETRAEGEKPGGKPWRVGINIPDEQAQVNDILTAFDLQDLAVATSGNYRNWYELNGVIYSHTINPFTGYPERTDLLSASVFTSRCAVADAYATAFMVMGKQRAYTLAEALPDIDIYLVVSQPDGSMSTEYTAGLNTLFDQ